MLKEVGFPIEILLKILQYGGRNLAFYNSGLYKESIKLYGQCNDCNCINFPQLFGIRCLCNGFGKCMNKIINTGHSIIIWRDQDIINEYNIRFYQCLFCNNFTCKNCAQKFVPEHSINYDGDYICNNCLFFDKHISKGFACSYTECKNIKKIRCEYKVLESDEYIVRYKDIACGKYFCKNHMINIELGKYVCNKCDEYIKSLRKK